MQFVKVSYCDPKVAKRYGTDVFSTKGIHRWVSDKGTDGYVGDLCIPEADDVGLKFAFLDSVHGDYVKFLVLDVGNDRELLESKRQRSLPLKLSDGASPGRVPAVRAHSNRQRVTAKTAKRNSSTRTQVVKGQRHAMDMLKELKSSVSCEGGKIKKSASQHVRHLRQGRLNMSKGIVAPQSTITKKITSRTPSSTESVTVKATTKIPSSAESVNEKATTRKPSSAESVTEKATSVLEDCNTMVQRNYALVPRNIVQHTPTMDRDVAAHENFTFLHPHSGAQDLEDGLGKELDVPPKSHLHELSKADNQTTQKTQTQNPVQTNADDTFDDWLHSSDESTQDRNENAHRLPIEQNSTPNVAPRVPLQQVSLNNQGNMTLQGKDQGTAGKTRTQQSGSDVVHPIPFHPAGDFLQPPQGPSTVQPVADSGPVYNQFWQHQGTPQWGGEQAGYRHQQMDWRSSQDLTARGQSWSWQAQVMGPFPRQEFEMSHSSSDASNSRLMPQDTNNTPAFNGPDLPPAVKYVMDIVNEVKLSFQQSLMATKENLAELRNEIIQVKRSIEVSNQHIGEVDHVQPSAKPAFVSAMPGMEEPAAGEIQFSQSDFTRALRYRYTNGRVLFILETMLGADKLHLYYTSPQKNKPHALVIEPRVASGIHLLMARLTRYKNLIAAQANRAQVPVLTLDEVITAMSKVLSASRSKRKSGGGNDEERPADVLVAPPGVAPAGVDPAGAPVTNTAVAAPGSDDDSNEDV